MIIEERGRQIRSYARNHVCLLGVVIFLLMAWGYRLDMFKLLYSESGFTFGAGYADVHARLYGYWMLLFVTIGCGGILVSAMFSQRRKLPLIAVGGMIISSVLIGGIYPNLVQYFIVTPN